MTDVIIDTTGTPLNPVGAKLFGQDSVGNPGILYHPTVHSILGFGGKGDNSSDNTSAINDGIDYLISIGGGTLYFPTGIYRVLGQIIIPVVSGGVHTTQPYSRMILFKGDGANTDTNWEQVLNHNTAIDLRYNAPIAKILGFGIGVLEFQNIELIDRGTDTAPFFFITHSQLYIDRCLVSGTHLSGVTATDSNDVFILGSTGADADGVFDETSAFRGQPAVITRCFFDSVSTIVTFNTAANGNVFTGNTVSKTCGHTTKSMFKFLGTNTIGGGYNYSNMIYGNYLEIYGYPHVFDVTDTEQNTFGPNAYVDYLSGSAFISYFKTSGKFINNTILNTGVVGGLPLFSRTPLTISGVATNGGKTRFSTTAVHGYVAGDYVEISGTTDYNTSTTITNISDSTHFDTNLYYTSSQTGSVGLSDYQHNNVLDDVIQNHLRDLYMGGDIYLYGNKIRFDHTSNSGVYIYSPTKNQLDFYNSSGVVFSMSEDGNMLHSTDVILSRYKKIKFYNPSWSLISTMESVATGLRITGPVGFNGTTPIAQPTLATGVGHTVDDVIMSLQNIGLVKQS